MAEEERTGFPEPEEREGDQEARRERFAFLVSMQSAAELAEALAEARRQRGRMRGAPRAGADPGTPVAKPVEIDAGPEATVGATATKSPTTRTGLGHTGRFVRVTARQPFAAATLRFTLRPRQVEHLDPATVLVARFDEQEDRLRLIPQSGYDEAGGYAYARVTRAGIYTAVGLPRDPDALATLEAMRAVRPLEGRRGVGDLLPRICRLILCRPEGGGVCELCLGSGPLRGIVELDIPLHIPPPLVPFPLPCPSWRSIGPGNVPGRITALALHPSNPSVLYAGTAGGGIFKTGNGGASWVPQWTQQLSLAIGGVAIAPSNPDVVYAATGEWGLIFLAGLDMPGVGVYKTSDGGGDWDLLAPIPSRYTNAIAVDPTDPDRVYVAGNRALHRTRDGGTTWDVAAGKLYGIFDGEVSEVVVDTTEPLRLYVGVQHDAVYRSKDGGATFQKLSVGLPSSSASYEGVRIALGRNGPHGTKFVAVKSGPNVWTSTDGGDTFAYQGAHPPAWSYEYANVIAVDPKNEDVLWAGNVPLYKSVDGGVTWTFVGGSIHPDQQVIIVDTANANHVLAATDGGLFETTNGGASWTPRNGGLTNAQVYTVGVSDGPTLAYGITTQDNACYKWVGGDSFDVIRGPEGGWIEYDPKTATTLYADTFAPSNIEKSLDGGGTWTDLGVQTYLSAYDPVEGFAIAHGNTALLLAIRQGTGIITRSTSGGSAWADVLSPGVKITSVAFAPTDDKHAYAGSEDGRVWHSADAGATWAELQLLPVSPALPARFVQEVAAAWGTPLRIYVALRALGVRQLWRGDVTAANKVRWTDATGAIPASSLPDLAPTALALDPVLEETIYVANVLGIYRSVDAGESWRPFDEGLPNTLVTDLDVRVHDRTLYAATFGRGLFRRAL